MSDTILSRGQRLLLRLLVYGGLLLGADAIFLSLFRLTEMTQRFRLPKDSLPVFYQVMVFGHFWLGIVLTPIALVFAAWHLGKAWAHRHNVAVSTGVGLILSMLGLMFTGFFILTAANSRENESMFWAHMALGAAMPAVYIVHRVTSMWAPSWGRIVRALGATTALSLVFLGIHCLTVPGPGFRKIGITEGTVMAAVPPQSTLYASDGKDPFLPFKGYSDVPRSSPFFPSAATTATGNFMPSRVLTREELPSIDELHKEVQAYGFVKDVMIGAQTCVRCHPDTVEQWSHSAHRFSSMNNPFYRKAFLDMRAKPTPKGESDYRSRSQWCSGCHEPALMLAGQINTDFDPDGANAQAGLTCLSCHAMDSIHNNTGNGDYNIPDDSETPYLFDETSSGPLRFLSDMIIKAKPTVHKQRMLKPFFRTAEYCAPCHKVALDVPVNGYHWFRGQDEYDNWLDSGVAQNAARTFYRPMDPKTGRPVAKSCQDCHMPLEDAPLGDVSAKNGQIRSHRFLGPNTALPALRGDEETIRRDEEFLQDGKMRIDVFALRRLTPDGKSEKEVVTALDLTHPVLAPGEKVEIHVVVRNKGVGHTFPGGTNDSNQGFVDFRIDEPGRGTILRSGAIGADRKLDPAAHRYGAVVIQHDGDEAAHRNAADFHVNLYANVIPPGTSDVVRYQFMVPQDAAGKTLEISADLMWRKFKQRYTDYVFAGKTVPVLPVTRICGSRIELKVAAAGEEVKPTEPAVYAAPDLWMRTNDYGIAQLLKNDTHLAELAFTEVQRIAPGRVDGFRNMARADLLDGHLEDALAMLKKCEEIAPGDAMTAYVWGNVLQQDGRYSEAERAFQRALQEFPQDRDTLRRLGNTYYLDQKFNESLATYLKVLAIDPEDREAHWHRVLNYQALGRKADADEARKAFDKYEIDASATAVANAFRKTDPDANREADTIHAHELSPVAAKPK
jgi:tetratricopeptide (TPR) repeat protein